MRNTFLLKLLFKEEFLMNRLTPWLSYISDRFSKHSRFPLNSYRALLRKGRGLNKQVAVLADEVRDKINEKNTEIGKPSSSIPSTIKPLRYINHYKKLKDLESFKKQITALANNIQQAKNNAESTRLPPKKYFKKYAFRSIWEIVVFIITNFLLFKFIMLRDIKNERISDFQKYLDKQAKYNRNELSLLDVKFLHNQSRVNFFAFDNQNELQEHQNKQLQLKSMLVNNLEMQIKFLDLFTYSMPQIFYKLVMNDQRKLKNDNIRQAQEALREYITMIKNSAPEQEHVEILAKLKREKILTIENTVYNIQHILKSENSLFMQIYSELVNQANEIMSARLQHLVLIDYRQGGYISALKKIKYIIKDLDRECGTSLNFKGLIYRRIADCKTDFCERKEKLIQALDAHLKAYQKYDKADPVILCNLGLVLSKLDVQTSLTKLEQVLPEVNWLAIHDYSFHFYENAYKIAPQNLTVLNGFALALAKNGDISKALLLINRALNIAPNNSLLLNNRGYIIVKAHEETKLIYPYFDLTQANIDLEKANNLQPGDNCILYNLGRACFAAGNFQAANNYFSIVDNMNYNSNLVVQYYLGLTEVGLGHVAKHQISKKLKSVLDKLNQQQEQDVVYMDEEEFTVKELKQKLKEFINDKGELIDKVGLPKVLVLANPTKFRVSIFSIQQQETSDNLMVIQPATEENESSQMNMKI